MSPKPLALEASGTRRRPTPSRRCAVMAPWFPGVPKRKAATAVPCRHGWGLGSLGCGLRRLLGEPIVLESVCLASPLAMMMFGI